MKILIISELRESETDDSEEDGDISDQSLAVKGFVSKFKQPDLSHLSRKRKEQCKLTV